MKKTVKILIAGVVVLAPAGCASSVNDESKPVLDAGALPDAGSELPQLLDAALQPPDAAVGPSLLANLVVSGFASSGLVFESSKSTYTIDAPFFQENVQVTATTADPLATIHVGGVLVDSGEPAEPFSLSIGDNKIDVIVEHPEYEARVYHLLIRRADELTQYNYGNAGMSAVDDHFGSAIAVWGDTLAVAAPLEDGASSGEGDDAPPRIDSGAVYVFRRAGTQWKLEAYLKAPDATLSDGFGFSLALHGDTLAVGAPYVDSGSNWSVGAVYIFRRNESAWSFDKKLMHPNRTPWDLFGYSVALWENTLAVGSIYRDYGFSASGAVYMFRYDDNDWRLHDLLVASDTERRRYYFGRSLSLWHDRLAIGSDGASENGGLQDHGGVYVFRRTEEGDWEEEARLTASVRGQTDLFGWSVALWDDALVVGAPYEDGAGPSGADEPDTGELLNSGAIYVFRRSEEGTWEQQAYIKPDTPEASGLFGWSVALWNGTILGGAYNQSTERDGAPVPGSGAAYVFREGENGWTQDAVLSADNAGVEDHFGAAVALTGDTLVVGAPDEDGATSLDDDEVDPSIREDSGAVYVFH